jgi:Putative metallopeptidase
VQVDECSAASRPYTPQGPVTICYELVDQIEKVAARLDADARPSIIVGAFIEATLHEVAHAVFDILQFPIWGRRGDAADRLAALVMLQFGEELAVRTITGTARFFAASEKTWTGSAFADVNSPEKQRFYNYHLHCVRRRGRGASAHLAPGPMEFARPPSFRETNEFCCSMGSATAVDPYRAVVRISP